MAIAAYIIKSIGGDVYENAREIYYSNLNNSIIIDMQNDNNDNYINDYLRETVDEPNTQ